MLSIKQDNDPILSIPDTRFLEPIADVSLGDVCLCFSDREGRDVDFVVAVVTDGN